MNILYIFVLAAVVSFHEVWCAMTVHVYTYVHIIYTVQYICTFCIPQWLLYSSHHSVMDHNKKL